MVKLVHEMDGVFASEREVMIVDERFASNEVEDYYLHYLSCTVHRAHGSRWQVLVTNLLGYCRKYVSYR